MKRALLIALGSVASLSLATAALAAREQIRIVGSSTVFPFATAVAEQFGKSSGFKTPVIESTGSGGGIKLFCSGTGEQHPDIANSSRRIKESEVKTCKDNGVADIVEIKIGFDGIVLASAKGGTPLKITKEQIFLALAKQVPQDGKLVPNPYKSWSDIDPSLPKTRIEVLGPPPTSGTRDAFVELAMEGGAEKIAQLKDLKKSNEEEFKSVTHAIREDGAYIDAGENDNLIVQKLGANPNAVGIFGYSFLEENADKLQSATIDGSSPTFENIASGKYAISRSLYFYVKKAHVGVIPGIKEYIAEFTSEKAAGDEGYLADKGLIPLPKDELKRYAADGAALKPMTLDVAARP